MPLARARRRRRRDGGGGQVLPKSETSKGMLKRWRERIMACVCAARVILHASVVCAIRVHRIFPACAAME